MEIDRCTTINDIIVPSVNINHRAAIDTVEINKARVKRILNCYTLLLSFHSLFPATVNGGLDSVLLRINSPYLTFYDIQLMVNLHVLGGLRSPVGQKRPRGWEKKTCSISEDVTETDARNIYHGNILATSYSYSPAFPYFIIRADRYVLSCIPDQQMLQQHF